MTKNICDIKELSNYLKVSIPQVRKLVRAKMIPYFRIGNRYKFDINEVNKWIENLQENEEKNILFL